MKKRIIYYFLLIHMTSLSYGESTDNSSYIEDLSLSYKALCVNNEKEYAQRYFDLFPDNYLQFVNIFGYTETSNLNDVTFGVLYFLSDDYICKYFQTFDYVGCKSFCKKTISICINGKWQADAVNLFQHQLMSYLTSRTNADYTCCENNKRLKGCLLSSLNQFSDEDILSFWNFYLDGPETISEELYNETIISINTYPRLKSLLIKKYDSIKKPK